jgi:hypothetical protein
MEYYKLPSSFNATKSQKKAIDGLLIMVDAVLDVWTMAFDKSIVIRYRHNMAMGAHDGLIRIGRKGNRIF